MVVSLLSIHRAHCTSFAFVMSFVCLFSSFFFWQNFSGGNRQAKQSIIINAHQKKKTWKLTFLGRIQDSTCCMYYAF